MLSAGYAPPGLRPGLLPQRGATASPPASRRIATWRGDTQRKRDGRNGLSVKVFPGLGPKRQLSKRNRRRADAKIKPQDRIQATRGDFSLMAEGSGRTIDKIACSAFYAPFRLFTYTVVLYSISYVCHSQALLRGRRPSDPQAPRGHAAARNSRLANPARADRQHGASNDQDSPAP